jgi:hypothetical protein
MRHFGVSDAGACLVRPDGLVAWRSNGLPDAPATCLREVLMQVAALPSGSALSESS